MFFCLQFVFNLADFRCFTNIADGDCSADLYKTFAVLNEKGLLTLTIKPNVFSLHSNSQLDINIKGQMIRDMMNLAGFRLPDKHDIVHGAHSSNSSSSDLR